MVTDVLLNGVGPPLLVHYIWDDWIKWNWIWFGIWVVPACILCLFLPESPELYAEKGEYDKARKIIFRMGKVNGHWIEEDFKFPQEVEKVDDNGHIEEQAEHVNVGLFDFFKHPTIVLNFIAVILLMSGTSFSAYLLIFYLWYIGGSFFVNKMVRSIPQLFSIPATSFSERKLGIKISILIMTVLIIVCPLPLYFIDEKDPGNKYYVMACVLSGSLGTSGMFVLVYLSGSVLFPSLFRGPSMGAANIFARIVTITSPQVAEMPNPIPLLCLGASGIVLGCTSLLLRLKKTPDELFDEVVSWAKRTGTEKQPLIEKTIDD